MAVRHLVFAQCAEACDDPCLQDVFVGLAYGLVPMCVTLDPRSGGVLVFRRATSASVDRDKAQRLATAAQDLQEDPDVAWYNGGEGPPLHVHAATLSVAWTIGPPHDVATHLRIVPALLRWTRWERDAAWHGLRAGLAAEAGRPLPAVPLRHLRLAQILEVVAAQARDEGRGEGPACQRAARLYAAGRLAVTCDPATNDVVEVREIAP